MMYESSSMPTFGVIRLFNFSQFFLCVCCVISLCENGFLRDLKLYENNLSETSMSHKIFQGVIILVVLYLDV